MKEVPEEGLRDIFQMDVALRSYRQARSEMAARRQPVVVYDAASKKGYHMQDAKDVRVLLYAAFEAYMGARSVGLQDAAEYVIADIKSGVDNRTTITPISVPQATKA